MIENGFFIECDELFGLIGTVYASTDAFAGEFEEEFPSVAALGAWLEQLRKLPGSQFLVARQGEKLLGFLFVEPKTQSKLKHTASLTVGIRAEAQGFGVGQKLLDALFPLLQREGRIEILYLMVRADNESALRLYRKSGFDLLTALDRDTKIGEHYFTGVLMRKFIQSGSMD